MTAETAALNGDMTIRVVMDTREMDWTPSPAGTELRKRFHRVGEVESGQVTSFVRYLPGSKLDARSDNGCVAYVKKGALPTLRSA